MLHGVCFENIYTVYDGEDCGLVGIKKPNVLVFNIVCIQMEYLQYFNGNSML